MKIKLTEKYFIEVTKSSFLLKGYGTEGKDIISLHHTMKQAIESAANLILMEEVKDNFITLHEYKYRLHDIKEDLLIGVYDYA